MTTQAAELSIEERIDDLKKPIWVGYPKAQQILTKLDGNRSPVPH